MYKMNHIRPKVAVICLIVGIGFPGAYVHADDAAPATRSNIGRQVDTTIDESWTTPTVTALVYYDGSPDLAAIHGEALLGFAEDPEYLPVVETDDPVEFGDAVTTGSYDVYVAVTSDAAVAEQWTEQIALDRSLAVFYPDASGEYEIVTKLVHAWRPDVQSPPPGWPTGPWTWDITDVILGGDRDNPPGCHSDGGGLLDKVTDKVADRVKESATTWWQTFEAWLEEMRIKVLEEAIERLEKIAEILESLPNPENLKTKITLTVGWDKVGPVALVTVELDTDAETCADFARKAAEALRSTTQPAP